MGLPVFKTGVSVVWRTGGFDSHALPPLTPDACALKGGARVRLASSGEWQDQVPEYEVRWQDRWNPKLYGIGTRSSHRTMTA